MATWTPSTGLQNYAQPNAVPALADVTKAPDAPKSGILGAAATATAQTREVKPNELVSNQVADITKQDSPLMQQANARALQGANKRGLLNTSIANESALGAVLDRATPIASANAATISNVENQNLANNQQTQTFNAQQTQNNNQFNAQQEQQNNQFNTSEQNKTNIVNASEQNKILSQFMDQSNRLQLADIEASYKTILQSEASAGTLYQQSVRNISDILQNPDLTPEAKAAAVQNQNSLLRTGLNILGKIGGLNLDGLLNFPDATGITNAPSDTGSTGGTATPAQPVINYPASIKPDTAAGSVFESATNRFNQYQKDLLAIEKQTFEPVKNSKGVVVSTAAQEQAKAVAALKAAYKTDYTSLANRYTSYGGVAKTDLKPFLVV